MENKNWEPSMKQQLDQPAGTSMVKSAGCVACWAAKNIGMTRACWIPTVPSRAL